MKSATPARTIILLVVLLVASGYLVFHRYSIKQNTVVISPNVSVLYSDGDKNKLQFYEHKFYEGLDHNRMRPVPTAMRTTVWPKGERERANRNGLGQSYDYLVVPLQVELLEQDRVTRLMTARWLAYEIARSTGKRVMSPELVQRALGSSEVMFELEEILAIARKTGASVVIPYIGRYENKHTKDASATLALVLADSTGTIQSKVERVVKYDVDADLLEDKVKSLAPQLVQGLLKEKVASEKQTTRYQGVKWQIPEDMDRLTQDAHDAMEHAVYLQFMALLTPKSQQYERRRLFERSLVALEEVDPSSDYFNVLKARALYYLYRRPEALKYLADTKTAEERAVLSYLNGNYPGLQVELSQISDPILYVLSYLELCDLGYKYEKNHPEGMSLPEMGAAWRVLIDNASHDSDYWWVPENIPFFVSLSGLLPDFDKALQESVGVSILTAESVRSIEHMNVLDSVLTSVDKPESLACCVQYDKHIERYDAYNLYRSIALNNVQKYLLREYLVYGRPESARQYAEKIEPWLQGNSNYSSIYADTLLHIYRQSSDRKERAYLQQRAYELVGQAVMQYGGSDENAVYALRTAKAHRMLSNPADQLRVATSDQVGLGTAQPAALLAMEMDGDWRALPYTNSSLDTLKSAYEQNALTPEQIDRELSQRFIGHPERVAFTADRLRKDGKHDEAISVYRAAIASGDDAWAVYSNLAEMLLHKGQPAEAKSVLSAYPSFIKVPDEKRVAVANYAQMAGSMLYWRGYVDEARSFYLLSSSLQTGAGAEYVSAMQLAAMGEDYGQAISYAYANMQRYGSNTSMSDYLTYMYLLGANAEADAGLRFVVQKKHTPEMSSVMRLGERLQTLALDDSAAWLKQYYAEQGGKEYPHELYRHLAYQAEVDRVLDAKVVAGMEKLPRVYREALLADLPIQSIYSTSPATEFMPQATILFDKSRTYDSEYVDFIRGQVALHEGRYDDAVRSWLLMERRTALLKQGVADRVLPYLAMASGKGQYADRLERLSGLLSSGSARDDYFSTLTRAVIAQHAGKADQVFAEMRKARNLVNRNPLQVANGWYDLVKVAEWLYQESGDKRILAEAVAWAKTSQRIQPQEGWAYAFEAKYGSSEHERIRATAYAAYLDRNSAWLQDVPAAIRQKADAWWKKNNTFRLQESKSPKAAGAI